MEGREALLATEPVESEGESDADGIRNDGAERRRPRGGGGWQSRPAQPCPCISNATVILRLRKPSLQEAVLTTLGVLSTAQLLILRQPESVRLGTYAFFVIIAVLAVWRLFRARDGEAPDNCISLLWCTVDPRLEAFQEAERVLRRPEPQQVELPPTLRARVDQLSQRTRICTRQDWEDKYLPEMMGADAAEKMRSSTSSCCICLGDIDLDNQVRGLACGHIFHLPCLAQWFMRDQTFELCCPLCRLPLSKQGTISVDDSDGAAGAVFLWSQASAGDAQAGSRPSQETTSLREAMADLAHAAREHDFASLTSRMRNRPSPET